MIRIGTCLLSKCLWGLMAVYLFNISIDPADPNPEHIPEDLSFNDQESIVEIVLEQFMGFEDAIKEYDDNDSDNNKTKNNLSIDLLSLKNGITNNESDHPLYIVQLYPDFELKIVKGFFDIDSPPPRI